MKTTLLLSASVLAYSTEAIVLNERAVPAVVSFDVQRNIIEDPVRRVHQERSLRKRDNTLNIDIVNPNDLALYWVNGTVGTPGQPVTLALDTGSSDTWVNVASSDFCSQDSDPCKPFGTYDHSKSSTYKFLDHNFDNTYGGGSRTNQIKGDYITETVKFGGATLKNFQIGVASSKSANDKGLLGVSYAAADGGGRDMYNNFPIALVDAGYIKSPAFSLYLNELHASKGQLLFGGVDTSKYTGELQSIPTVAVNGVHYSLEIALTGLSLKKDGKKPSSYSSSSLPLVTSLDCGSTTIILPESLTKDIFDDFDVKYNSTLGAGLLPCSMKNNDWNLTYSFSGVEIDVSMRELVLDPAGYEDDELQCLFGIVTGPDDLVLMGDPFLRSAYAVFDLANNEISLAQANFNPGKENIREIGTGKDAVPGATKVKSAVTSGVNSAAASATTVVGPVETVGAVTTVTSGSTAASTSSSSSAATSTSKGLAALPTSQSMHLVAGIAGAVGLAVAL
ncbi:aspartic-type endopeptidase (OpsB), putative [Paecilomyces variotii No. 5]|uniref:Aspartic-type endopeptidase (OpsB), putative n=1 Tax=Byssochlamys spectabilis (strain No. 5 / NBRC 109023) TaxID=1356009 RepID=V5FPN5_BYSSN|nr:aspartic-type endopeptidase (OpsB), putative [Paecilomyces variotii No. 5]